MPHSDTDLLIRPATPSDFAAIRALHLITHDEHMAREDDFDHSPFAEESLTRLATGWSRLRNRLSRRKAVILVAERNGAFLGHLIGNVSYLPSGRVFSINDISLMPEARRQSIGTQLIAAGENLAAKSRCSVMLAGVWPRNTASISLFRELGYHVSDAASELEDVPYQMFSKSIA